jgi:hypothetical protein
MNNRVEALNVLYYRPYERLPIVHFGFWNETMDKWAEEGHISVEEAKSWGDGNAADTSIGQKLGFDFNWYSCFHFNASLNPPFDTRVMTVHDDGSREIMNGDGVIVLERDGATGIPSEIAHTLKNRQAWRDHYLPRLQWTPERVNWAYLDSLPEPQLRDRPIGLHCGSLWGRIRDITGVVGLSYMMADEPELVEEMAEVTADLCYQGAKAILEHYDGFDFAHFWEDICYKSGPLVNPKFFHDHIGPYYKRITDLVHAHGIQIVSLDCDGKIDKLIPTWFENGVNTMFPIEVGTWNASITPWRSQYGKELRGVGGMNKVVFSRDRAAIDAEVERLKPMVEMGGYLPCPDHRLAPDSKWENVQYYCERMRTVFS